MEVENAVKHTLGLLESGGYPKGVENELFKIGFKTLPKAMYLDVDAVLAQAELIIDQNPGHVVAGAVDKAIARIAWASHLGLPFGKVMRKNQAIAPAPTIAPAPLGPFAPPSHRAVASPDCKFIPPPPISFPNLPECQFKDARIVDALTEYAKENNDKLEAIYGSLEKLKSLPPVTILSDSSPGPQPFVVSKSESAPWVLWMWRIAVLGSLIGLLVR